MSTSRESLSSIHEGMAPTSPLGTTKATTIFVLLLLFGTAVADSADVGNGSESGAQRQRRTPRELVVVTPDKMDAMAGSTLILPCSYTCTISGVTTKLVEWFRITNSSEERIYQYVNRESSGWTLHATWVGDVSKCDASIIISDIQTHDSGRYCCEVTVHPQYKKYIGHLQLNVHPRTELAIVTPEAKKATVGSTALLPCSYNCTITGINHTLVEWFRTKGGHDEKVYKIIHRKRSLRPMQVTWVGDESTCDASITISNIQTHDAGLYRCEVTIDRYDKPSMQDIGYLQLNVQNESEPTDATPTPTSTPTSTPTPTSAPAPLPVVWIALGVIAALLVAVTGVVFYCRRRLRPEAPVEETHELNQNGQDGGARSGQVALAEQGDEANDEEGERETST